MMAFNKKMTFVLCILSFFMLSFLSIGHCVYNKDEKAGVSTRTDKAEPAASGATATGEQAADSQKVDPCKVVNTQATETTTGPTAQPAPAASGVGQ